MSLDPQAPQRVKSLRFLVETEDGFAKIATIAWNGSDACIYVTPHPADRDSGFVGIAEGSSGGAFTVDLDGQGRGAHPCVSLHRSGVVHAKCVGYRTPSFQGRPLHGVGGHIATIATIDDAGLQRIAGGPRVGARCDFVIRRGSPDLRRLVIAIYVADAAGQFSTDVAARLELDRPTVPSPLYFGFAIRGEPAVGGDEAGPGVVVLAGWGPGERDGETYPLVFAAT